MGLFSSSDEPSERARELAEEALGDSVTTEVLDKQKASGFGSHDYLADGPLLDHIEDSEQPHFINTAAGPAAKVEREHNETISSTGKYRVILVLADQRILVVLGDEKDGDWNFELSYENVIGVGTQDGGFTGDSYIRIQTEDEIYTFSVVNFDDEPREIEAFIRDKADISTSGDVSSQEEDKITESEGSGKKEATRTPTSIPSGSGELSEHLDCEPQGEWVNREKVAKVEDLLDDDELVHYMWRGGTIDVEGSSAGESIFGNDRDRKSSFKGIFTAITNKRIVIAIPQFLGDDERHIPYRSVTSVDLDTGLMARRVSLQTKGQTYHIQANGPSKDELREAMRFIREKVEEVHQPQQVQASSEPDPTEQLKNLKELHDEGVLSDEEFEEKKQSLMDKI